MKKVYLLLIILLVFKSLVIAQSNINQEHDKPVIALLGTFHFKGSSDMMSLKTDGLSSPKRQNEIEDLVKALVLYNPTKIILEYPY